MSSRRRPDLGDSDSTIRATLDGSADTPVSSRSSRRAHAIRLSPSRGVPPGSTQSSSPSCVRWTSKMACLCTTATEHRTSKRAAITVLSQKQDPLAIRQSHRPEVRRSVGGIHHRAARNRCLQNNLGGRVSHRTVGTLSGLILFGAASSGWHAAGAQAPARPLGSRSLDCRAYGVPASQVPYRDRRLTGGSPTSCSSAPTGAWRAGRARGLELKCGVLLFWADDATVYPAVVQVQLPPTRELAQSEGGVVLAARRAVT